MLLVIVSVFAACEGACFHRRIICLSVIHWLEPIDYCYLQVFGHCRHVPAHDTIAHRTITLPQ